MRKLILSCESVRNMLKDCRNYSDFEINIFDSSKIENYMAKIYACEVEVDGVLGYAYWEIDNENMIRFALV